MSENEEDETGAVNGEAPKAPNTTPLRRKKKGGLGSILSWLKGDQSKRQPVESKGVAQIGIPVLQRSIYTLVLTFDFL